MIGHECTRIYTNKGKLLICVHSCLFVAKGVWRDF
jgi:hypothetical protein